MRGWFLAATAAALALATPAAAQLSGTAADKFLAAVAAFEAQACDRAAPLMDEVIASPEFAGFERHAQSDALRIAASCAVERGDAKAAYAAALRAVDYQETPDGVFATLFEAADDLHRPEDAVAALELAIRWRRAAVPLFPVRRILQVEGELNRKGDKALSARWREALDHAEYRPAGPFQSVGWLWLAFARQYAAAGDDASVRRVLARIDDPHTLARALVDARFTALMDADPGRYDAHLTAERKLARDRADLPKRPELLAGAVAVAADQRAMGRPKEALAVLDAVLPKARDPQAFEDFDAEAPRYWDARSRTLWELGRRDEAISALRSGVDEAEARGRPDSDLILLLADRLVRADKPQAALDLADRAQTINAGAYGPAVLAQVRAQAYAALGRGPELAAALELVRAHGGDSWRLAAATALLSNAPDAAAAAYIKALSDPDACEAALVELSDFNDSGKATGLDAELSRRRKTIHDRPDVQAAIAKAGRTLRFDFAWAE